MNKHFIDLVNSKKFNYIGMGNPDANILIIGQEHAVDQKTQKDRVRIEVDENRDEWEEIINNQSGIREFDEGGLHYYFAPNVGYTYVKNIGDTPKPFLHGTNKTSGTWPIYKRLLDGMLSSTHDVNGFHVSDYNSKKEFDIFPKCFMSELSAICAKKNLDTDHNTTKASIHSRMDLWKTDFFQNFETVIIAAGRYDIKYKIDYSKLFPKAKLVIITPQLSSEQYVNIKTIVATYLNVTGYVDLRSSMIVENNVDIKKIPVSDSKYCIIT